MNLFAFNLILLTCGALVKSSSQGAINSVAQKHFIYNVYKYDEIITLVLNQTVQHILDFDETNDNLRVYPTRVHVSTKDSITQDDPLFITALQQKGLTSWQLPMVIQPKKSTTMLLKEMDRTLCAHDDGAKMPTVNRPLLQVSTSNPRNVTVEVKVKRVQDFYVVLDKSVNFTVTPSQPKYYLFSFDNDPNKPGLFHELLRNFKVNYTIPKSVMLIIESDNDVCATISIQPKLCPVYANEQDMLYQGHHLTMASKGGIAITETMFPVGFYIIFIVNHSDDECTGDSEELNEPRSRENHTEAFTISYEGRRKNFKFRVVATISSTEYTVGTTVLVAITLVVALLVVLIVPFAIICKQTEVPVESRLTGEGRGTSEVVAEQPEFECIDEEGSSVMRKNYSREISLEMRQSISSGESLVDASVTTMTVAGLSRTQPRTQVRRSNRYFYTSLTVAVVYSLPVIQLLFTYQQTVFQTGNQDLCYYNFLCAHPLGLMSDFNHVYSNVAYMILGVIFMMQIRYRQHVAKNTAENIGIPRHHGLFYSMGLGLVMEGLLSGCYHLCPNKMNFQVDSSFMYVIAVLCMVKLYQNRHPDVNASAHSTYMLLAAVMTLGVIGILYPTIFFWELFTLLHLGTCLVLTIKIYYFGRFRIHWTVAKRAWKALRVHGRHAFLPERRARALLLALANLVNWVLALYGLSTHNKDFAQHLLAILMGNTILYTMFYFVMKLINRERIFVYTWLYFIFAHIAWFTALRFFLDAKTEWSQTPAASRALNSGCSFLQFYDSHDVWHLLSAAALFLSFNLLLTMDDALKNVPTHLIPVF